MKKAWRKRLHIVCFHSYAFLEKVKLWGKNQISDYQGLGERGKGELQGMQKNLWKQGKYSIPWLSEWLHYCTCLSNFIKLYTNKVSILLQVNFIPQYIWLILKTWYSWNINRKLFLKRVIWKTKKYFGKLKIWQWNWKTMEGLGAKVEEICQKVAQNKEKKNGCWEKNSIIKRSVQ